MRVEQGGAAAVLERVPSHLQTTTPDKIFWSHFSPNLAPAAGAVTLTVVC